MTSQDKNNQIIFNTTPRGVNEIKHPVALRRHPSTRGEFFEAGHLGIFPSHRGVPEGRGVFPSLKGESANRGVSWHDLPFNPKLKQRAKELRKTGNLSEVLFWNQVKNKQFLNLDFDRQKIIGNYIVDFYCKNLSIVVEIDGQSHNEKQEYDEERDNFLKSLGLKIFHIRDIDIKKNIAGVLEFLRDNITPRLLKHPVITTQCHPSTRGELKS